jgi:hypothetical protein
MMRRGLALPIYWPGRWHWASFISALLQTFCQDVMQIDVPGMLPVEVPRAGSLDQLAPGYWCRHSSMRVIAPMPRPEHSASSRHPTQSR